MSLSQTFEEFKDKCPWKDPNAQKPQYCVIKACRFENCAIFYWLERAFIHNNPGDVDLGRIKDG